MTSQRAPRRSWLRVHPFTIVVALGALLVTTALAWTAHTVNDRTEDRLLRLKVAETGAVLQAALPRIQTTLAPAVKFAETGSDPVAAFTNYIADYAGENKEFDSASLWQLNPAGAPRLVTVVGQQPELATRPAQLAAVLNQSTTVTPSVRVVPLFAKPNRRIGYAYSAGGPHRYVIYAESPLPADGRVPRTPGTPFSDLTFALYLGKTATPANLIEANAAHLGRRTASVVVPFGDQSLDVVASANGSLGGSLSGDLWWIVAIAGVLLSLAAALITEHLLRRRENALALAAHVQSLLQEQRTISDSLQQAMVPASPPTVPGLDIGVRYLAGATGLDIGGDWYDVVDLGDGRTFLSIGDVSGRGIQAGAIMSSLRSAVRAFLSEGHGPAEVLQRVTGLLNVGADGHFATVLVAIFDRRDNRLTIACAGHLQPLLITAGRANYLDLPVGPPVGATRNPPRYAERVIQLPAQATLLLFTDGLVERRGETIDDGLERLRCAATHAPAEVEPMLTYVADELQQNPSADDDTAILGVRWA
ncbi:MAG TPA: PP2C family protein-serine/threonine phosphatase [Jatrophihabitans sp.]|nr:PP2C family protein-serine/threonine phosphatase [Jatrophihabitans sp.]